MANTTSFFSLCSSSNLPFPSSSLKCIAFSRAQTITCCANPAGQLNNAFSLDSAEPSKGVEALRIVFAAGGTGSNIYPAVALADEFKSLNPSTKILFIGNPSSMESKSIPSLGYKFSTIPAVKFSRPLLSVKNLFLPIRVLRSMIKSWRKLKSFKPDIVFGTGGYVSFPVCFVAKLLNIVVLIQEQNSVPGVINWTLSRFADTVFVAFNSTIDCFPKGCNCVVFGNPVRSSLRKYVPRDVARLHFFPKVEKAGESESKVLVILGGSLGANPINIAMLNIYRRLLEEHQDLFIIWQTGVEAFDEMDSLVREHPQLLLCPFLQSMDMVYGAADLLVSRAGAMTCSEILATGKPAILIPSPYLDEGHQFRNASLLADLAGSRVLVEEELDSITLGLAIEELLDNGCARAEMSERALKASKPNSATEIAHYIISRVKPSKVA